MAVGLGAAASVISATIVCVLIAPATNAYFLPKPLEARPSVPDEIAMPSMTHARQVVEDEWQLEYYINPTAAHPAFEPVLDIRFSNLTRRQFRKLRNLYRGCGSSHKMQYQSNCTVVDFLSPWAQATWGTLFQPEDERGRAPLFYQCYGFMLDIMQLNHGQRKKKWLRPWKWFHPRHMYPTLSTPDSRSAYEALLERTDLVANDFPTPDALPGDVIMIYHDNSGKFQPYDVWLDHMLMFVDGGLLLEKSGSGNTTPFRLVDYNTFESSWGIPGVFLKQVRRPRRNISILKDLTLEGTYSLPEVKERARVEDLPGNPNTLCGSTDADVVDRLLYTTVLPTTTPLERDGTGRGRLPPNFYEPFLKNDVAQEVEEKEMAQEKSEEIVLETSTGRHANEIDKHTARSAVLVRIYCFGMLNPDRHSECYCRAIFFVIFSQPAVLSGELLQF